MGDNAAAGEQVSKTFRALVETADRKFVRVRDIPLYTRLPQHYIQKVFKSYTKLWKFQQENRLKLVESGLERWEIGEIASRIGQLYYGQYMRTSETRFLLEAYVFYEAILNRGYFERVKSLVVLKKDLSLRFKELRFYARFLVVALILNRVETVKILAERFRVLVDETKATFRETNLREWKLVVQEILRFIKADTAFMHTRPLRYCTSLDSHPSSLPYVARFHAKKVLKLRDTLLTSYHRNEVRFTELTLDTFRMVQCLEWEPSGSFFQMRTTESSTNGGLNDQSGPSGLIDINLAMDMTDPSLPPNPRKAILYRPSITQLITVIATCCEELPPDSIFLIYLSASGTTSRNFTSQMETSGVSRNLSKLKISSKTYHEQDNSPQSEATVNRDSNDLIGDSLCLGHKGGGDSDRLYPGDLIPFTRKPLFLIIDSDNSHAFKVIHGAERGEGAALLLSPQRPSFRSPSAACSVNNGSQFTFFLTSPVQAFCQLVGLSPSGATDKDTLDEAETILSSAFSEWEVKLCTVNGLDLVWAQVLSDPFLRRLILRFIFCRSVLSHFFPLEDRGQYLPSCLPPLPDYVSPTAVMVQNTIQRLATSLRVEDCFHFNASLHPKKRDEKIYS